jgi:hypothetical protein
MKKIIKDLQQNLNKIKIPILSKKEYPLEEIIKIINIQKTLEQINKKKIEIEKNTIIEKKIIIIRYMNDDEILKYKEKYDKEKAIKKKRIIIIMEKKINVIN